MTVETVRRLAADILNIGRTRVWINPDEISEVKKMATRADVKGLIDKGTIKKLPVAGRKKNTIRKTRAAGSRKGRSGKTVKELWMEKVRAQRKLLRKLLEEEVLPASEKRNIYRRIKSGIYKNKNAMIANLKDSGMIPEDYREKKEVRQKKAKPAKGESK
jgi:large subunit ribosomal protein L19e